MTKLLFILAASACGLSAQVDSDSITVTASRDVNLPPTQLVFSITVHTNNDGSLADVHQALQSAGLNGAVFTDLNTAYTGSGVNAATSLDWSFELRAPVASLKPTLALLESARLKSKPALAYSVGSDAAPTACNQADLLGEVTSGAQKLASAAGVGLGPVVAMSDAPARKVNVLSAPGYVIPVARVSLLLGIPVSGSSSPAACALTVKFRLLRYQN